MRSLDVARRDALQFSLAADAFRQVGIGRDRLDRCAGAIQQALSLAHGDAGRRGRGSLELRRLLAILLLVRAEDVHYLLVLRAQLVELRLVRPCTGDRRLLRVLKPGFRVLERSLQVA